ncbi:hypothetical protein JZ751_022157 [Albula glossodonta]|uniref:Uncharacterized protein n=1 Tax=Albula glossodonta TaxID=121402 RepID=A0A8T2NK35_9TELE|nr:hypothetical protein JZ751_022157 [Albula glossodonta]
MAWVCDFCIERKVRAVKLCQTCTVSYCETHARQHYTVAALQRHTLMDVTGDLEPGLYQLQPDHKLHTAYDVISGMVF